MRTDWYVLGDSALILKGDKICTIKNNQRFRVSTCTVHLTTHAVLLIDAWENTNRLTHGPPYARVCVREGVFGDSYCSHTVKRHHCVPFQMKTPGASEPRYAPPFSRYEGDEERRLSVRPPERYKPPCNSHPHRSVSSGQYRQNLSSSPFNRAALERSSIWIWIWTGPWPASFEDQGHFKVFGRQTNVTCL